MSDAIHSTGRQASTAVLSLAGRPHWADRAVAFSLALAALIVTGVFAWILIDLARRGLGQIDWAYVTGVPSDAGRSGGIGPIILNTLVLLSVCLAVTVPLGLAAALLLGEFTRQLPGLATCLRRVLDVLASVPSIVYGLFGNAFFCKVLGMGFSLLAGGLTLACMALPLFVRTVEASLTIVPMDIRRGAAALGLSRWTTCTRLLLPAALPGILGGLVLAMGRALAETAALIFTSGYVDRAPSSLMDSGRALSVHVYDLAMNVAGGESRAAAAAVVLVLLLIVVNGLSRFMLSSWAKGGS